MSRRPSLTDGLRVPVIALAPLVAWGLMWNSIGRYTFGYGPLTFACILGIGALVHFATPGTRRFGAWVRVTVPLRYAVALLVGVVAVSIVMHARILSNAIGSDRMIDVGRNTLAATRQFFVNHANPYATQCQMGAITGLPHVSFSGGHASIFGVQYDYGFPYFPVMFLAYGPFRRISSGLEAIRYGNVAFLVAAAAASYWLCVRIVPGRRGSLAAWIALASMLPIWGFGYTLFKGGVTDLMIAVFALFGFIALTYRADGLAGVAFGLAIAAKLTPGALLVPILIVWQMRRPKPAPRWKLWVGLVGTVAATVVPFIAWNPRAFLASTWLYIIARHSKGDDSSLWYFLPDPLKSPFTILGGVAVLTILVLGLRRRSLGIVDLLAVYFLAQLAVAASYRMIHNNYLWAVLPIGCVAFATRVTAAIAGDHLPVQELDNKPSD